MVPETEHRSAVCFFFDQRFLASWAIGSVEGSKDVILLGPSGARDSPDTSH